MSEEKVFLSLVGMVFISILILSLMGAARESSRFTKAADLCDKQGYFQAEQKRYTCKEVK